MNTGTVPRDRHPGRLTYVSLAVAWLAFTTLATGCQSAQAAKKVKVGAQITAAEDLNPDYQGRPSPINIVVFQLSSADAFMNADFFSLFDPDSTILGTDVLGRTQLILQPGEQRQWNTLFEKETRFVGVIAAFRDIENAEWRAILESPRRGAAGKYFRNKKLRIAVDSLAVTVSTK